jgi:hypothetical protein
MPIHHNTMPLVGTHSCVTCVGVYFRIDGSRCFVAHMSAISLETHPANVVTDNAGQEIKAQVVSRLNDFSLRDE